MRHSIAGCVLACGIGVVGAAPAHAQFVGADQDGSEKRSTGAQIENGGLAVRILFVGRNSDGKSLTISTELRNVTDAPVYIAIIGPTPSAIDTQGVTYELVKHAGLAACSQLTNQYISQCISGYSTYLPGESFSMLQPGAASVVALTFQAEQASTSGFLSVALNVALAKSERPSNKRETDNTIDNVAISFPMVALEEEKG